MIFDEVAGILEFVGRNVVHVAPAFLISVGLGVLIRFLKLDGMIRGAFNRRIGWSILLATLVGAFSPFCSCSVVPVVASLLLSGVPLAPVMSFWIASPTMDPEIFTLSVATLGWPLAVARLGATLALSLAGGYLTLAFTESGLLAGPLLREKVEKVKSAPKRTRVSSPAVAPFIKFAAATGSYALAEAGAASCGCSAPADSIPVPAASAPVLAVSLPVLAPASCGCSAPAPAAPSCGCSGTVSSRSSAQGIVDSFLAIDWRQFGKQFVDQTWRLGRWMLLAFLLEALIDRYVAQDTIARWVGGSSLAAVPLASLIGIPLYLNNVTALPIVSGLLNQGMQSGAAIAFLIAGPITTIPAMAAVWGTVERRVFALYLGIGFFGSIVLGYLVNLILP